MSSWFGYMSDPLAIETRFSLEDSLSYMDMIFSEPSKEDLKKIDDIRGILDKLPPREADFVDLYYFRHLKQTDIATIFKVSQPTVCYRLQRATMRIRFLLDLPELSIKKLKKDLKGFLTDSIDVDIMVAMYKTCCQSDVAKNLNVSQGFVRHRFIRTIDRMGRIKAMEQYAVVFKVISENLSVLREIRRSGYDDVTIFCVD